jgi:hypothetical protein
MTDHSSKISASVPSPTAGAKPALRDGTRQLTIGKELFGLRRNVENIDDIPLAKRVESRGTYSHPAGSTAFMSLARRGFLFAFLAASLSAQTIAPSFTRYGLVPAQSLMPNDLVTIYGEHLAPATGCNQTAPSTPGIYPTQMCGTQVTVDGIPAGLLAVLEKQINLRIPQEVPAAGDAAVVVTVNGVSSQPVMVAFGKPKVMLSVEGPAYVHMPVWIALKRPLPYNVAYPYALNPGNFGGGRFEVRHNGIVLKPLEIQDPPGGMAISGRLNGSIAPAGSPPGRLPLHLQYRFDTPGRYEIRFIGTRLDFGSVPGVHEMQIHQVQVDESDWTEIDLLPYSDAERGNWIQEQIAKMPSSPGLLVGDAIPGLLAVPDQLALRAILPGLYHSNDLVRRYVAASLTMFDNALVANELTSLTRDKGPTEEIARMLDQKEELFRGGHQALLAAMPGFLNSGLPLQQAGALQYLVWSQNHDWGKTAEFKTRLSAMVLGAAHGILESSDARLQQLLAEALGSIKTDPSRDLLWLMIETGKSEGQSRIALTWIGDLRDLARLAGLLTRTNPADPNAMDSSLPYSLHRAYGDASLPLLKQAARDTTQVGMRISCAKELIIAGQVEGFQYLLQAMDERPSFKPEALQFARDHFAELRGQNEGALLAFLKTKAGTH